MDRTGFGVVPHIRRVAVGRGAACRARRAHADADDRAGAHYVTKCGTGRNRAGGIVPNAVRAAVIAACPVRRSNVCAMALRTANG